MKIKDLVNNKPISVGLDTPIGEVARLMNFYRIHGLPVVDEQNKVIGIITESDFFMKDSSNLHLPSYIDMIRQGKLQDKSSQAQENVKKYMETKARDIMSSPCFTVLSEDDINVFIDLIKTNKLHTVPIVNEENVLQGVITVADIIGIMKIEE